MASRHRFGCAFAYYRSVPLVLNQLAALAVAIAALVVLSCSAVAAHGIAGNRLFPGTLSFDDPAVSDEFAVTPSWVNRQAADGTAVTDRGVSWEFMRLLVPNLAAVVDSGFIHRDWPQLQRNGFDTTTVSLKGLLYESDPHEVLLSAKMSWGIGRSGASAVGPIEPNIFQPALYFGKGFGDLPDRFEWLRPFAVTGELAIEIPAGSRSTTLGVNSASSALIPIGYENVPILHWGFSIQYSTYYLTSRFTGGAPKQEPLNQFVPLVEFTFDSPSGKETIANMNPGVAYAATTWQLAVEAVLPLNAASGRGVGVRAQLLLFLDDLAPSLFGKPLLSQARGIQRGHAGQPPRTRVVDSFSACRCF
jgi:hypothetical protein